MFAGKYLLYEVQCMKHEHLTRILCVYCSELRLLVICSFCFFGFEFEDKETSFKKGIGRMSSYT